jgi:protein SCO1/2
VGERPRAADRGGLLAGGLVLAAMLLAMGGLLGAVIVAPQPSPAAATSAAPSAEAIAPASFTYPTVRQAAPLELTDQDGRPFSLAALRGRTALVFFGYTHCPDVCPATTGIISQVLAEIGSSARAVFVTVDPERDTVTWLHEYVSYLHAGFTALTGTDDEIRAAADAWGVRYARVETGGAGGYSMSHTAEVYLVDANGDLRAHFPFGTKAPAMETTIRGIAASLPSATPSAAASVAPSAGASSPSSPSPSPAAAAADLTARVVSSSVWAGGSSPLILRLSTGTAELADPAAHPMVELLRPDGSDTGASFEALPVRPPGVDAVSYVAIVDIPSSGAWRLGVTVTTGGRTLRGSVAVTALDPGTSARLGEPAPTVRTPTLADVAGVARAITTDPNPDARLYQTSTVDALGAHTPFVLIVDSSLFRVSQVCGKAVLMARFLLDRWPDVAFIHSEPFVYTLVSDWPVLSGVIADPPLDGVATAWGIAGPPWGNLSVPWVFVVDGNGIVRAKYEGLMGTDDIDVMLAFITGDR